ncbi:MAG: four helix bundle protein [Candidatus Yanofskybacteria bacterium]|nr:four helix bundle protein [Candidatus Yanofskybacteria bacterium]
MRQETSGQVGYRKLIVWQKSHQLAKDIYKVTNDFLKSELFGLTSQMRRCAVSVPANLVGGYSRKTIKDKLNFFVIARSSLTELEYYLDLSFELNYIKEESYHKLTATRSEVGRLLNGFINSFQ